MSFHNLGLNCSIVRIMNAQAAGAADATSSALDVEGYDGVLFLAGAGAVSATAVASIKAQQSSDDGAADAYSDIAGSASAALTPTTDNNKTLLLDVYRPQKRYLKVIFQRATANCVIDGIWAIRYHGKVRPAALDATIKALETLNSPAEGTA